LLQLVVALLQIHVTIPLMDTIQDGLPIEVIAESLAVVRNRIARLEQDRVDLDKRIAADREEERLLTSLVALRRGEFAGASSESKKTHYADEGESERLAENPLLGAVIDELTSAGRPIHISELMRLLEARKVPLPGAGAQANLIIYLRRDPRIVRPSRGTYGLAEWGLTEMSPSPRRRKRRRKARAQA
jgi:hypothetical protein